MKFIKIGDEMFAETMFKRFSADVSSADVYPRICFNDPGNFSYVMLKLEEKCNPEKSLLICHFISATIVNFLIYTEKGDHFLDLNEEVDRRMKQYPYLKAK